MTERIAETACTHEGFKGVVNVHRYVKKEGDTIPSAFVAEVTVECRWCKAKFRFLGVEIAEKPNLLHPTVDADGTALCVPMEIVK